jgi:hypothetical protein
MLQPHNCLQHKDISAAFTKSDTAGEVSFSGTSTLTNTIFRLVPHVNRVYLRLRQQYHFW